MIWEHSEVFHPDLPEEDQGGRQFVLACCARMGDAAAAHAVQMGLGVASLHELNLAWVLARIYLEIPYKSSASKAVQVKTWPVEVDKLQFRRDFLLSDADGRVCIRGVTIWVVMDLETRKLKKMPEFITGCPLPASMSRVMEIGKDRTERMEGLPELASFAVRREDIDSNRHVNNVRYLHWMMASVPEKEISGLRLSALRVQFRAEALYGDTVIACGGFGPEREFRHGLYRALGPGSSADPKDPAGRELVRGLTVWM